MIFTNCSLSDPVYYVSWLKKTGGIGGVASVRLFLPAKTLLQFRVEDSKYILRPPIAFTNLAELLSQTNAPLIRPKSSVAPRPVLG
jgi:hypothetical protein